MSLYTFIRNLLNVLVQIANKMGLQKTLMAFYFQLRRTYIIPLMMKHVTLAYVCVYATISFRRILRVEIGLC
jgi:hypothetical protein